MSSWSAAVTPKPQYPTLTPSFTYLLSAPELSTSNKQGDQEQVQAYDHRDDSGRDQSRHSMVDQRAHEPAIAAEHEQRDEREGNTERENDLAEHEGASRIEPDRDHDQRGRHRDGAAQEQWDLAVDESLHYHLAGKRAHR